MLVEIMTGKPPSKTDPESMKMRAQLEKECAEIESRGGIVDIPFEIPDLSDED